MPDQQIPGDPQQAAWNHPIVRKIYDYGVTPDELDVDPAGMYTVTRDGKRICFGVSSSADSTPQYGWDYSVYDDGDPDRADPVVQDWAETYFGMVLVLASQLGLTAD